MSGGELSRRGGHRHRPSSARENHPPAQRDTKAWRRTGPGRPDGPYLAVGGAGLEVAPGVRLVTTPGFPVAYKAEAGKGAAFLEPPFAGEAIELDVPVAIGAVYGWRANRQVPARDRAASDRDGRKKLDILRGFRSCARRRNRPSGRYPQAFDGWLLTRQRPGRGRLGLPVQGLGGRSAFPKAAILSVTTCRYIRRARADPFLPDQCRRPEIPAALQQVRAGTSNRRAAPET
jgi:hypothetical protein